MISPWNSKTHALEAFDTLIKRLPVKYVMISYSSDSLVPIDELIAMVETHGKTAVREINYKRHIMSQIVGEEAGKQKNKEYLILVKKGRK
jgi:adenine-specific DNA methylase